MTSPEANVSLLTGGIIESDYCTRLLKGYTTTGYIERVNKNGVEILRLTPQAKTKLRRDIPLPFLQKRAFDGYFRAIPYDFPEKLKARRDSFRLFIKRLGFGLYQKSLWITAHPLEEVIDDFVTSQNLSPFALRFMSKRLSVKEGRMLAQKVWPITAIESAYHDFIDKWGEKLREGRLEPSDQEAIRFAFFSLLEADPHLPFSLLPSDWPASKAKDCYLMIEKTLQKL